MKFDKMKRTNNQPKFGGGIVCDIARTQSSGKIDAIGIFTMFWAWGYPANRNWSLIISLFYVPKKQTALIVGIRKKGSSKIETLGIIDISDNIQDNQRTINVQLGYSFEEEGDYEIICTLKDYQAKLVLPFFVRTREWPIFSPKELEYLEKHKDKIQYKLSAQIKCKDCGHLYNFEEIILQNEPVSGGAIRFPESGEYECEDCGRSLKLKDIQGQIRASIKNNLVTLINSNRHV
jgi:hypothetical protein